MEAEVPVWGLGSTENVHQVPARGPHLEQAISTASMTPGARMTPFPPCSGPGIRRSRGLALWEVHGKK